MPPWNAKAAKAAKKSCLTLRPLRPLRSIVTFSRLPERMTTKPRKPLYTSLYFQVLVGIALGVAFGFVSPERAAAMKPLGDGFIKLVKMMIAPIVFTTVVVGI